MKNNKADTKLKAEKNRKPKAEKNTDTKLKAEKKEDTEWNEELWREEFEKAADDLSRKMIGDWIRKKRLEKEFTGKEFSEKIGIPLSTLYRFESGAYDVPFLIMLRIYKALGITYEIDTNEEYKQISDFLLVPDSSQPQTAPEIMRSIIQSVMKINEIKTYCDYKADDQFDGQDEQRALLYATIVLDLMKACCKNHISDLSDEQLQRFSGFFSDTIKAFAKNMI